MTRREELNNTQYALIDPLLPKLPKRENGKDRSRRDNREVLNGILWILRSGVLRQILEQLAEDLRERGKLDLSECFVDAAFVSAKKGALP